MRSRTAIDYDLGHGAFKRDHKVIKWRADEPEDCSHFCSTSLRNGACVVAKGNAAMPTDLIATTSELSSGMEQLGVALKSDPRDSRSRASRDTLRIDIAVAIEITVNGSNVNVTGSIGLRTNRA